MQKRLFNLLLICLVPAILAGGLLPAPARAQTDQTVNILLVGNSWFQGADRQINRLTEGTGDLWANGVYHGGYSLFRHWRDAEQLARITAELERGIYDYVLLMDIAKAVINAEGENTHRNSVLTFKAIFDEYGVQTMLAMPWAYITEPEQQPIITANEYALAQEFGLRVAPVGEAFRLSTELRPDLPLLVGDGDSHPGPLGDYLRNLVVYSAVMERSPEALAGIEGLSQADEDFLKAIAWEAVRGETVFPTETPTNLPSPTPLPTETPAPTAAPSATATAPAPIPTDEIVEQPSAVPPVSLETVSPQSEETPASVAEEKSAAPRLAWIIGLGLLTVAAAGAGLLLLKRLNS